MTSVGRCARLGWVMVGAFSLVASEFLLLANESILDRLVWLVASHRFEDNPLGVSGAGALQRGIELWGWFGILLGTVSVPLWSGRFRSAMAVRFFEPIDRFAHRLPLQADRYDRKFFFAVGSAYWALPYWPIGR